MGKVLTKLSLSLAAFLAGAVMFAQTTVSGVVRDKAGQPVIGAAVVVTGTTNGAATDLDGRFSLSNVRPNDVLEISSIGYESVTIPVGGQSEINVTLNEDSMSLEGTVVIGYGVQKKSDITGSISSVNGSQLVNRPVETVQQALSGKVAGVQVLSASGAPGEDPQIRVRGFASNSTGASNPLYVVDGLKVSSIAYLDPSMIESMEVLKDGASAAIYGAEAGNGVVLITTKQGKGNGRVFYDFTYGINKLGKKAEVMNAQQYADYQRASGNGTLIDTYWNGSDTDWFDVLYGDKGTIMRHTVGFEAGNDKGSLYTAVSYLDNEGMYYGDKDYLKRLTYQVNADYWIKPWLQIVTNNSIETSNSSDTQGDINKAQYNSPYLYDPTTPAFYPAGNLPSYMQGLIAANGDDVFMKNENGDYVAIPGIIADRTSPLTWYYSQDLQRKRLNVRGTTAINFKPVDGLVFTSRLGYNLGSAYYQYYGVPVWFSVTPRTKIEFRTNTSINRSYDWENFVNFNKTLGEKHAIAAMAGMSYRNQWSNFTSASTDEITNYADNFHHMDYSTAGASDGVGGQESLNRSISYFGRLGYTFDNRYNIQATFRADAFDSSYLAKESRWGYFPSVSVGWIISNESFMEPLKDVVSFAKLRASYGINGNINVLGNYAYASSLSTNDYYPINGQIIGTITPSSVLANPSLRWERSKQFDVGLDLRFLQNRLLFTADYYNKDTDGQLISMTSPVASGTTSVTRNVGLVNNSGLELELGWRDTIGDFSYSLTGNFSTLHNLVKSTGGQDRINKSGLVYFEEGQPVWSYWGYNYIGVGSDGAAQYEDIDGNGTINAADRVTLGTPIPKVLYGINLSASWKNFDLTVFGSGAAGNKLFFNSPIPLSNKPAVLWTDSYAAKGAGATYPTPDANGDQFFSSSSMLLFDGSFFKIKQISLGYTVPQNLLKKIAVSSLRVFASLDNWFCFTKYVGMDPENVGVGNDIVKDPAMGIDSGNMPSPKALTLGVNLSF